MFCHFVVVIIYIAVSFITLSLLFIITIFIKICVFVVDDDKKK